MNTVNNIYGMVMGNKFRVRNIEPLWRAFHEVVKKMHPEMAEKEIPFYIEICRKYNNEA